MMRHALQALVLDRAVHGQQPSRSRGLLASTTNKKLHAAKKEGSQLKLA
jgi:hypothetical protein